MLLINSTAFIAITGNGLTVSEDLARRFNHCELDAGCEDPELRPFPPGFLENIERNRAALLGAVLTIWRYGRQNAGELASGKPLGGFEIWAGWCRDPLLDLGCRDPVERIGVLKSKDPRRQQTAEIFTAWWTYHQSKPIAASELNFSVQAIIDPQGRGRQYIAAALMRLAGTRAAGFVLTRQESLGTWTPATYALRKVEPSEHSGHNSHTDHRPNGRAGDLGQSYDPYDR
jgi:hypothetical protein